MENWLISPNNQISECECHTANVAFEQEKCHLHFGSEIIKHHNTAQFNRVIGFGAFFSCSPPLFVVFTVYVIKVTAYFVYVGDKSQKVNALLFQCKYNSQWMIQLELFTCCLDLSFWHLMALSGVHHAYATMTQK